MARNSNEFRAFIFRARRTCIAISYVIALAEQVHIYMEHTSGRSAHTRSETTTTKIIMISREIPILPHPRDSRLPPTTSVEPGIRSEVDPCDQAEEEGRQELLEVQWEIANGRSRRPEMLLGKAEGSEKGSDRRPGRSSAGRRRLTVWAKSTLRDVASFLGEVSTLILA